MFSAKNWHVDTRSLYPPGPPALSCFVFWRSDGVLLASDLFDLHLGKLEAMKSEVLGVDGVNLGGHQLNLILSRMKSQFFCSVLVASWICSTRRGVAEGPQKAEALHSEYPGVQFLVGFVNINAGK